MPREAVIGRTLAESLLDREDLLEVSDAILGARHRPNDVHERELVVGTPAGSRHLVVRSSLLKDQPAGRPVGLVATFQDVSAQVQLMRQRVETASLFVLLIISFAVATVIGLVLDRFTERDGRASCSRPPSSPSSTATSGSRP